VGNNLSIAHFTTASLAYNVVETATVISVFGNIAYVMAMGKRKKEKAAQG